MNPPAEQNDPTPGQKPTDRRCKWLDRGTRIAIGAAVGTFCGYLFSELAFADRSARFIVAIAVLVFGSLTLTRLRGVVHAAGAFAVVTMLIIGFTPLVPWLLQAQPAVDVLEPADAIVSLGAGIHDDGSLASGTVDRVIHSFTLLHRNYAPRLVLTGGEELGESTVREQMRSLGLNYPIENAGPVNTTHDEAVAVAKLVQAHRWHRVILVTHGWHMPRAAAAFEKAGVHVLRSPCADSGCDMVHPTRLADRVRALACILHEKIGYRVYRMRGWV